jgi:hypothetical protein
MASYVTSGGAQPGPAMAGVASMGVGGNIGGVTFDNSVNVNVTNHGPKQSDYSTWKEAANSTAMQTTSSPGGFERRPVGVTHGLYRCSSD